MPLLILLAATGLLFLLQRKIYEKYWARGLDVKVDLGRDRYIFEGDSIHMEEELSNNKLLPLPWVYVKYQLSGNGKPKIYASDMFSILFRQRIRRKKSYTLEERGVYTLGSVDLISHDLFLTRTFSKIKTDMPGSVTVYPRLLAEQEWPVSSEQLTGEVIARRFYLEDPYIFKGIREYQTSDSFRRINFRASAKVGQWMVNVHETTISQRVTLLLGMDKGSEFYDPVLYEHALRIAGTLAAQYENAGIPVELISNGTDALLKKSTRVEAGCGAGHVYEVLEALARMNLEKEEGSITAELEKQAAAVNADSLSILITPCWKRGVREAYQSLCERQGACFWFMPVTAAQEKDPEFEPARWKEQTPGLYWWKPGEGKVVS